MSCFKFNATAADITPDGSFFWHATTIENVFKIIAAPGLAAVGTGALGSGFYLTTRQSDYQRAMALRVRNADAPLFMFFVLVPSFWSGATTARLLAGWDSAKTDFDFSAVQWSDDGAAGSLGTDVKEAGIPDEKDPGKKTFVKYGQTLGKPLFPGDKDTPNVPLYGVPEVRVFSNTQVKVDKKWVPKSPTSLIEKIWAAAQVNHIDPTVDYAPLTAAIASLGPRNLFHSMLLELALHSQRILDTTKIVGVQLFDVNRPVADTISYNGKTINISAMKGEPPSMLPEVRAGAGLFANPVTMKLEALISAMDKGLR